MIISKRNTYIFRLFVYLMLFVFSYLAVAKYSDARMRQKALTFCGQMLEGEGLVYLTAGALEAGGTLSASVAANTPLSTVYLTANFPSLVPFDGYSCNIQMSKDRVVAWNLSDLNA